MSEPSGLAIAADALVKTYGKGDNAIRALDGISLAVPAGSVFAVLGPNGAGKSTTVKILTTLTRADSGTARVAGLDLDTQAPRVRAAIGYVSQRAGFDPVATGRENLVLQGRVRGLSAAQARLRAAELLGAFGLLDAADRRSQKWSGGMQRRLDVAMGLVHRPGVLFLDEPTVGLDPESRAEMWSEIGRFSDQEGLTVVLTTHYLDEADQLADELVIVDRGRIVAGGTPQALKSELAGDTVHLELLDSAQALSAATLLRSRSTLSDITTDRAQVRARVRDGSAALPGILGAASAAGLSVVSVTVGRPTLGDVYLRHAGRSFQKAHEAAGAARSSTQSRPEKAEVA